MDANQLKVHIIEPSLRELGLFSDAAVQLLMLTCAQESKLGHYIVQIRGPALGIFQVEPATYSDMFSNYLKYKPELSAKLSRIAGVEPGIIPPAETMIYNLKYAAAIARIHYLRAPDALPELDDIASMANYYKKIFNTHLGKATAKEAMDNYARYVEV